MAIMRDYKYWDIGGEEEAKWGSQVADYVDQNAGLACEAMIAGGYLWFDYSKTPQFEFTDDNFEFRKVFAIDDIELIGDPDNKKAAIQFLHALIGRLEASED